MNAAVLPATGSLYVRIVWMIGGATVALPPQTAHGGEAALSSI